jgi:hypothetical protein
MREEIFVFGSNRAGRHGLGAAKDAVKHYGAIYGCGEGLQGSSYAIPTKNEKLVALRLDEIRSHIERFIEFAEENAGMTFRVTRVGCGLAGYKDDDIAPMFADAPANCLFPPEWSRYGYKVWQKPF